MIELLRGVVHQESTVNDYLVGVRINIITHQY
jgi:hypothetical protein